MSHPSQYKSATPKHHCWNFIAHPLNREHYRVLWCIYTLTVLSTKSWDGKDQDHCHARYCRRMCTTCTVGGVLSLQRLWHVPPLMSTWNAILQDPIHFHDPKSSAHTSLGFLSKRHCEAHMQDLLNKAAGHQSRDRAECEQSAHNCSPYFGVHVQHCDLTSYWSHSG